MILDFIFNFENILILINKTELLNHSILFFQNLKLNSFKNHTIDHFTAKNYDWLKII